VEARGDEAEDELVVVPVEALAFETDVVGVPRLAVGAADHRVLAHHPRPLDAGKPVKAPVLRSGLPDRHGSAGFRAFRRTWWRSQSLRSFSRPLAVRPADHRETGNRRQGSERRPREEAAGGPGEGLRVLRQEQDADPRGSFRSA